MITLDSDTLQFRFPEIESALRRRVERHIRETLPRLLAADRRDVAIHSSDFDWWSVSRTGSRKRPNRRLVDATPEEVEAALRGQCQSRLDAELRSAGLKIEFQRTLRIPDDGRVYPLPAGLGNFPLRHIDDFAESVPGDWLRRGGVLMPMYQSEALWISFDSGYPFAVMVAAGKINAVTGEGWSGALHKDPQNYVTVPGQPWLDGFAVGEGVIRQFVAMPLGEGYSVEEQLTGSADVGGLQLQVFPMREDAYWSNRLAGRMPRGWKDLLGEFGLHEECIQLMCSRANLQFSPDILNEALAMGLGAGGTMRQEIYRDRGPLESWDRTSINRCFIHLCHSQAWRRITGSNPPHRPLTAGEYAAAGVPWFDFYRDDLSAVPGSAILAGVQSVATIAQNQKGLPLPGNDPLDADLVLPVGPALRPAEVRQWT